jgi:hypothetical protein
MNNAHLRLARLRYEFYREKRQTSISVCLDRLVAKKDNDSLAPEAHMLSVVGADAEIAAISAALSNGDSFTVEAPGQDPLRVSMQAKPKYCKGAISLEGRSRTLRHLVALSQQWVDSAIIANPSEIFLLDSTPEFVWTNIAYVYGLPACPDWAAWFHQKLVEEGSISQLLGVGCDPILISGTRELYLSWLGQGVASGVLKFPDRNGPVVWPNIALLDLLVPAREEEAASRTTV